MTACETFSPTGIILVYNGLRLGDVVHAATPEMVRQEEISKQHNYWADAVILDGRYPALVYNHSFLIFKLSTSRFAFANFYYGLSSRMKFPSPCPLSLKVGSATIMWFGDCYLDNVKLEDPQQLLMHHAGNINLNFIGTVVPSLVSAG